MSMEDEMRTVHRASLRRSITGLLSAAALVAGARQGAAQQVTVSGVGYVQYAYQFSDTANHANNFDITRAYINVIGRFAGGVGTRVTGDIYQNADGSRTYRLKYAYVTYTPEHSPLTYKIGQMHTPWIDWEEALWDYRMQGQMAMERGGYMSSSDFGAGVDGKWGADRLNMQVGIYNGENYNKALGDQRKDLMARVSYRLLATDDGSRVGGLRLTGYAQYGAPTTGGQRQRFIGMLSYKSTDYTVAAEYAVTKDSTTGSGTVTPVASADGSVASVFGVLHLPRTRWAAIGRVDLTDPNTDTGGNRTTRFIGGVSYQLTPNLRVLGDLEHLAYESGTTPTPAQHAVQTVGYVHVQFTF